MSGMRYFNFREGDRSEYLANYLLSGIGLVTPVPRQEDIGIDFYCSIADQEKGKLTFGFPYLLQIKSISVTEVVYGKLDNNKKWHKEDIQWLFRQELPMFFGFVDKKQLKVDIYNSSALWFLTREHLNCSQIHFKRRKNPDDHGDVTRPTKTKLENWPTDSGDGYCYDVDLCQPIVSLSYSDFENEKNLMKIKNVLRSAVSIEQNNLIYKKQNLPSFHWILDCQTNEVVTKLAWIYYSTNGHLTPILLRNLTPPLISLSLNLKMCGRNTEISAIKPLLKQCPRDMIYQELIEQHPDIFDWLQE